MSKRDSKIKSPAIWRIAEKFRPISGDPIGDYLQCAIPNLDGRDFRGRPVPRWDGPYKLEPWVLVLRPKDINVKIGEWQRKYALRSAEAWRAAGKLS